MASFDTYDPRDGDSPVTVEFEIDSYGSPGGYWEPPEGPAISVTAVYAGDVDVLPVLTGEQLERIETRIFEGYDFAEADSYDEWGW